MNVRGVEITIYDEGEGEAVLFLHGWGSEFRVFRPVLDSLVGHYRALALDMPGFGDSAPPTGAWTVDEYADFVLDFLNARGVRRAVVIGHSFGGRVGIKLAARGASPLDIPKMILVDAPGIKPKKTAAAHLRQIGYKAVRNVLSFGPLREACAGVLEQWRRSHASEDYLNATPLMREVLVKVVNEDLAPCLPRIKCPTLLIWGEHDADVPMADARIMEAVIPGSGLAVVAGAGHYPFLDQPYVFGRIVDSFLNIER